MIQFLIPIMTLVFCYGRIALVLSSRIKVTLCYILLAHKSIIRFLGYVNKVWAQNKKEMQLMFFWHTIEVQILSGGPSIH